MIFIISCSTEKSDFAGNNLDFEADAEDLDANGLPKILFNAQLPVLPNDQEYIIELDRWDIPNNSTDAIKTTANLQAAID